MTPKKLISNQFVRDHLRGIIEKTEAVNTEESEIIAGAIRTVLEAVKGVRL